MNESFSTCAALMWIINDFSAYALMSGWSTKGELACLIYRKNMQSKRLTHRKSLSFMRHRCFLYRNYPYKRDAHSFDGIVEKGEAPNQMSESKIFRELVHLSIKFEKGGLISDKKRKHQSKADDTHFN